MPGRAPAAPPPAHLLVGKDFHAACAAHKEPHAGIRRAQVDAHCRRIHVVCVRACGVLLLLLLVLVGVVVLWGLGWAGGCASVEGGSERQGGGRAQSLVRERYA